MYYIYVYIIHTHTRLSYLIFTVPWAFPYNVSYKADCQVETTPAVKPGKGHSKCCGKYFRLVIMHLDHKRRIRGNGHKLPEGNPG